MALIQSIKLTITPVTNSENVSVYVGYIVSGSNFDVSSEQSYREVCELIGDDTPGDGTDDPLRIRKLLDTTTVFSANTAHFTRAIQLFIPLSALDEDNEGPAIEEDEIRARVTLTPLPPSPTRRESNMVRTGGISEPNPG